MQIQVLCASRIHSSWATRSNLGSCAKQALSTYLGTKPPRNLPAQLRIGLLTLALVLTGLTTTVLANDLHWAHSFVTGRVTIVLVIMLVAMICGTMAILVTQIRWVASFFALSGGFNPFWRPGARISWDIFKNIYLGLKIASASAKATYNSWFIPGLFKYVPILVEHLFAPNY